MQVLVPHLKLNTSTDMLERIFSMIYVWHERPVHNVRSLVDYSFRSVTRTPRGHLSSASAHFVLRPAIPAAPFIQVSVAYHAWHLTVEFMLCQ